jgi:hypothetical protein
MKKKLWVMSLAAGLLINYSGMASATTYTFSDNDFLGGASWGTMDISTVNAFQLMVQYTASLTIPQGSQATGFGFSFDTAFTGVSDPANGDFSNDLA